MPFTTALMVPVMGRLFCGRSSRTSGEQPQHAPLSPAFATVIQPERLQRGPLSPGASPEGFRVRNPPPPVARPEWLEQSLASGNPGAATDRTGLQSRAWARVSPAVDL